MTIFDQQLWAAVNALAAIGFESVQAALKALDEAPRTGEIGTVLTNAETYLRYGDVEAATLQ